MKSQGKYAHVMSLGRGCLTKYHIERVLLKKYVDESITYYPQCPEVQRLDLPTCFFDWCITPLSSFPSLLDSDFKTMLQYEHLELVHGVDPVLEVVDRATGVRFPHLVPDMERCIKEKSDLVPYLESVHKKYQHIIESTRSILDSQDSKLFILYSTLEPAALTKLFEALASRTQNYQLLLIEALEEDGTREAFDYPSNVIHKSLVHQKFPGLDTDWDEVLWDYL